MVKRAAAKCDAGKIILGEKFRHREEYKGKQWPSMWVPDLAFYDSMLARWFAIVCAGACKKGKDNRKNERGTKTIRSAGDCMNTTSTHLSHSTIRVSNKRTSQSEITSIGKRSPSPLFVVGGSA